MTRLTLPCLTLTGHAARSRSIHHHHHRLWYPNLVMLRVVAVSMPHRLGYLIQILRLRSAPRRMTGESGRVAQDDGRGSAARRMTEEELFRIARTEGWATRSVSNPAWGTRFAASCW